MVFNRFRIMVLLRVAGLCLSIYLFFYLLLATSFYATLVILGGLTVWQVVSLIHYVERTNRDLNRFLLAIRHSDFTTSFSTLGLGASFDTLKESFSEVIAEFQRTRAEKEEHFRYLQTVVQHVGIGLLAFNRSGEIELVNTAAKRLLRIQHLNNISVLSNLSEELVETLFRLTAGEKALLKVELDGDSMQLVIYATEFSLRNQGITLVSIQNIQSELEEQEIEAWQKLIRVLTHEIMNSVTPISSLSATVGDMIESAVQKNENGEPCALDRETTEDITGALDTIQKRSSGLIHFVDAYRNLTLIPKPNFEVFSVDELIGRITRLLRNQADEQKIDITFTTVPESLEVTADQELIEQTLINLVVNSMHALNGKKNGKVSLSGKLDERGRVLIQVTDNGPGIDKEVLDRIFIPFFTTRKGGSGIGLSLTKQIMRLHRGTVTATSEPDKETTFTLRF